MDGGLVEVIHPCLLSCSWDHYRKQAVIEDGMNQLLGLTVQVRNRAAGGQMEHCHSSHPCDHLFAALLMVLVRSH